MWLQFFTKSAASREKSALASDRRRRDGPIRISDSGGSRDAILVIEVAKSAKGQPEFVFGVNGMTQNSLIVTLDDREVWTKPQVPGPGRYDTWTWITTRQ